MRMCGWNPLSERDTDSNQVRRRNRKKTVNECCVFAKFVKNEAKAYRPLVGFFVALSLQKILIY
jgi:hypothetical protein